MRFVTVHFLSQLNCTLIKQNVFKSTHNLPGGESNPGLLSDSQRYLPLYYRGLLFTDIFCSSFPEPTEQFINKTKGFQKHTKVPRRKIESRSPEWQLETLTAILPEDFCLLQYLVAIHFMSQLKCSLIKQKVFKSTHKLPGEKSNLGLLSDSQRYLPPYYQGLLFTEICCSSFPEPTKMYINKTKSFQKHT